MSSETPDWNVAIMDGQPEVVVNLAGAVAIERAVRRWNTIAKEVAA